MRATQIVTSLIPEAVPGMNTLINPLMDANKLRNFTSQYKRHSIRRLIRPLNLDPHKQSAFSQQSKLRQSAADYFFVYCRQVLPRMEEKIELQLLEKFKDSLHSVAEKKEVHLAYLQRKDNLSRLSEVQELGQRDKREESITIPGSEISRVIQSVEGDGLSFHTFEDIGRYTVFPEQHHKRMFPEKMFGNYEADEFQYNETFGLMCREEGLRITNDLARLRLPHERKVDYQQILALETGTAVKEAVLKDEERFFAVQQDFSLYLLDYINKGINNEPIEYQQSVRRLFQSSSVFDSLVTILVQELRKKPIRYHLCVPEARVHVIDQIVRKLVSVMTEKKLNPQKMGELIEHCSLIVVDLDKKHLGGGSAGDLQNNQVHQYKLLLSAYHKVCNGLWRPEDIRRVALPNFKGANSGLMLWGDRGSGKSQILSYVSAWAHENKWAVLNVPRCEAYTDGKHEIFRFKNGLYLQHKLAKELLVSLRYSNELLFRNTDVDMSVYGTIDISGVKDGEPEPCPRVWDAERQCWSDAWKEELYDFEIKSLQQKYEEMNTRCGQQLPSPKKIIDILDFGIANPELATSCFGELLEQLYHTDKFHTLVAIDGFNDWLKPSNYLSFRYDSNRSLRGYIPPQDFAIVRMLMRFDGHMMRNGFKALATTHMRQYRHTATPEMLSFPEGYHAKVQNLALNDFRNMVYYYNITEWMPDFFKEWQIESWYMETQGNWWAFHQSFNRYQRVHY